MAEPACPCQEEHFGLRPCRVQHCSIQAWGQLYAFEFLEDHALLSSSFVSSQVVNSSFVLLRRFPGNCFAGGKALQPAGASSRVTFCEGQLVSMSRNRGGSFLHQTCVNHPLNESLPSPWIANIFGITQRWIFICFSKEWLPWARRRFTSGQSGAKMWLC